MRGLNRITARHRRWRARHHRWTRRDSRTGEADITILAPFERPFHVALDDAERLYVAEFQGHRIVRLNRDYDFAGWLGGGAEGWQADTGPARPGDGRYAFHRPHAVDLEPTGGMIVTDLGNARVQVFGADGVLTRTIGAGFLRGPASALHSTGPEVLVSDAIGNFVAAFDPEGRLIGKFTGFNQPHAALRDPEGNLIVVDTWNHRVVRIAPSGEIVGTIGRPGPSAEPGSFDAPVSLALDENGSMIIAEFGNHRVQIFDRDGQFLGWMGGLAGGGVTSRWSQSGLPAPGRAPGAFRHPYWARSIKGVLYVADTENHRIQIIRPHL